MSKNEEHKHSHDEERKMFEQQLMQQQIVEFENQLAQLESKKLELQIVYEAISEVNKAKGSEMVAPVGPGVFARAKISDDEKLLVNIGANILLEKTPEEAQELVAKQMDEIDNIKKEMENELAKFV